MNPALGAFLTRDPFEGVINRSLSRNAYAYAEDNPVNYTDPSGLFVNPLGGLIGAGIGAVAGGAGAFGMHRLALSGACGCELQHWAEQTNPWDLALKGAITGGIVGGLSGLFPMFAGEIAAAAGGVGFGASVVDIAQNGLNLCNAVGTAASVGGGLSGRSSFSASMTDMTISVSVNIGGAALRNFAVSTTAVVVSGGAAAVSGALGGAAFFFGNSGMSYQPNPKHGPSSREFAKGKASAEPLNGQAALDNSVQVKPTSPRRVGVDTENEQIVVLDETHPGQEIYHGHVREWSELTQEMQNALKSAGLVDKRGRIIK